MRLVLASKSPRRIALLKEQGMKFEIIPSQSPERSDKKRPAARVKDLAVQKAFDVAQKYPDAVVIGGGVSKAGQVLLDGIAPYFKKYVFHAAYGVKFALASLGNDAGAYGAFKLILDESK